MWALIVLLVLYVMAGTWALAPLVGRSFDEYRERKNNE